MTPAFRFVRRTRSRSREADRSPQICHRHIDPGARMDRIDQLGKTPGSSCLNGPLPQVLRGTGRLTANPLPAPHNDSTPIGNPGAASALLALPTKSHLAQQHFWRRRNAFGLFPSPKFGRRPLRRGMCLAQLSTAECVHGRSKGEYDAALTSGGSGEQTAGVITRW